MSTPEELIAECCKSPADSTGYQEALDLADSDREFRRELVEQVTTHRLLRLHAGHHISVDQLVAAVQSHLNSTRASKIIRLQDHIAADLPSSHHTFPRGFIIAAAAVLLSAGVMWFGIKNDPKANTQTEIAWTHSSDTPVPQRWYVGSDDQALRGPNDVAVTIQKTGQVSLTSPSPNQPGQGELLLTSGSMRVVAPKLSPNAAMRFNLPDGSATIIGTDFQLVRRDGLQSVVVNDGTVRVMFPTGERLLAGGESWHWLPQELKDQLHKRELQAQQNQHRFQWQIAEEMTFSQPPLLPVAAVRDRTTTIGKVTYQKGGLRLDGRGIPGAEIILHLPPLNALDQILTFELVVHHIDPGATPYELQFATAIARPEEAAVPVAAPYPGKLGQPLQHEIIYRAHAQLASGDILTEVSARIDARTRVRMWSSGTGSCLIIQAGGHDLELQGVAHGALSWPDQP